MANKRKRKFKDFEDDCDQNVYIAFSHENDELIARGSLKYVKKIVDERVKDDAEEVLSGSMDIEIAKIVFKGIPETVGITMKWADYNKWRNK